MLLEPLKALLCLSLVALHFHKASALEFTSEGVQQAIRISLLEGYISRQTDTQQAEPFIERALTYLFGEEDEKRLSGMRRNLFRHVEAMNVVLGEMLEGKKMSASNAKRAVEAVAFLLDAENYSIGLRGIEEPANRLAFDMAYDMAIDENRALIERLRVELAEIVNSVKWNCFAWLDNEKCQKEGMERKKVDAIYEKVQHANGEYREAVYAYAASFAGRRRNDGYQPHSVHVRDVERTRNQMKQLRRLLSIGDRLSVTLVYTLLYKRLNDSLKQEDLSKQWLSELLGALKRMYKKQRQEYTKTSEGSGYSAAEIVEHWDKLMQ